MHGAQATQSAASALQCPPVDALLAFAAALLTLRSVGGSRTTLSACGASRPTGRLGGRRSARTRWPPGRSPGVRLPAGATPAFRVYYLGGALLSAALLGAGSLLLAGRRWVAPVALVYTGLAVGVALAVPLQGAFSGTDIPEAQEVLDLWPARVLAIVGNSLGTLAVVGVAVLTFRHDRSGTR